jgi:hypothetical protein
MDRHDKESLIFPWVSEFSVVRRALSSLVTKRINRVHSRCSPRWQHPEHEPNSDRDRDGKQREVDGRRSMNAQGEIPQRAKA